MNLPAAFTSYTSALLGEERFTTLMKALTLPPPVSIRLNPLKWGSRSIAPRWQSRQVAWCNEGYHLSGRPEFTFDPLWHSGTYYVQEAASMFIHHVIRHYVHQPVLMLDLCAAPGGKSTAARSALPSGSMLICNDPVRPRAQVLAENMLRYGHPEVIVTNNMPADYANCPLAFDVILADVPCSGEGMFRKDEVAVEEWSPQHVEQCRTLQREIVRQAWQCLKPGGLLIYSTCTINRRENEENAEWICHTLGGEALSVPTQPEWGILGSMSESWTGPAYRFIPGFTESEGLFMTVIRKDEDTTFVRSKERMRGKKDKAHNTKRDSVCSEALQYLHTPDDYEIEDCGDWISGVPRAWHDTWRQASQHLRIITGGVPLLVRRGHDSMPHPALPLSAAMRHETMPHVSLDYTQAIRYLRREPPLLPNDTPRGWVTVCYDHQPLGLGKHIGQRTNNLYPQEWRIRTNYTPEQPCGVVDV